MNANDIMFFYVFQAQQRESPINYHIGEKLLHANHDRQRKNMSFTNEKVCSLCILCCF